MKTDSRGIMINIDINSSITGFLNDVSKRENVTEPDLYPFVDCYRDSQVTDVLICGFCQFSQTPSLVFSDFAFKCGQKTENGVSVDYTNWFGGNTILHTKYGIDPYDVWFRRLKTLGIRPWLSVRMNDCHCPDEEACFLRSEFFYEAREKGWMVGPEYGYYRYCFNYAVPEVRAKMLAYLREQLTRYDVYGLELDFQREIICFDYLHDPECHKIMTAFLREVRALVKEMETVHGHRLVVAVRLARDIGQNKIYGFDAEAIANEKLADMFIIAPRWATCDSGMPIAEWVRRFPDISVVAGLEILVNRQDDHAYASPEVVRGYTSEYLAEGSDGIYLFNHFFTPEAPVWQEIYHTCGYPATVGSLPRRFVVTYQDICPANCTAWHPLPMPADGRELRVAFGHGAEKLSLIFSLASGNNISDLASVTVNGETFSAFEPTEHGHEPNACYAQPEQSLYRVNLPESVYRDRTALTVSFRSADGKEPVLIGYLEIDADGSES